MSEILSLIRPGTQAGLDFVMLDQLRKRTGIEPSQIVSLAVQELTANALDKDATEIDISIQQDGKFVSVTVSDNGSANFTKKAIESVLDFDNKASSKRGINSIQRGALGNALKSLFGYSYAMAKEGMVDPAPVVIESQGKRYEISITPDFQKGKINHIMKVYDTENKQTSLCFTFYAEKNDVVDTVTATHLINPDRKIKLNHYGEEIIFNPSDVGIAIPERATSVDWYTNEEFVELFRDYRNANPDLSISEFISLFRGFSGRKSIREVMDNTREVWEKLHERDFLNQDSENKSNMQFFPTQKLSEFPEGSINALCQVMKDLSKPIGKRTIPNVLGCVGEERFRKIADDRGWLLRYGKIVDHVVSDYTGTDIPHIIEIAFFERKEGDQDGLKVYQCVNFMTSPGPIFNRIFNIEQHLGQCGIFQNFPGTILIHLITPKTVWLNYSKTEISPYGTIAESFHELMNSVFPIPKTPKVYQYKEPKPDKAVSWVPSGTLGNEAYENRLKEFAEEMKGIQSRKPLDVSDFSVRGWCYFMEGLGRIDKGQFDSVAKAINDCRKIGYLPIDFTSQDRDASRKFGEYFTSISSIENVTTLMHSIRSKLSNFIYIQATQSTDFWKNEKYYVMMVVEKIDIYNLFKPICDERKVPIANGKGWSTLDIRYSVAKQSQWAEENGMTPVVLLFGDHDPVGLAITDQFRKNINDLSRATGYRADNMIIERFGLNKKDIDENNLIWIDNLKTSSGKDADESNSIVREYIAQFGRKKVEANAIFRNAETIQIAKKLFIDAIEKYQGNDLMSRFDEKISERKEEILKDYGGKETWDRFIDGIEQAMKQVKEPEQSPVDPDESEIHDVFANSDTAECPVCGSEFSFRESDIKRLLRCRNCGSTMRIKWEGQ